ncbi:MAG: hypothetical protein ACFFCS_10825 [Candidatus Hodarchaeota archaeon]
MVAEKNVNDLIVLARDLAKRGEFDEAINKIRECMEVLEIQGDYLALADMHLLVLDYEKEKAQEKKMVEKSSFTQVIEEPEEKKEKKSAFTQIETPAVIPDSDLSIKFKDITSTLKDTTLEAWIEGKDLMKSGKHYLALQKFLNVERNLRKMEKDEDLTNKIYNDIKRAREAINQEKIKKQTGFESLSSSAVGFTSITPEEPSTSPGKSSGSGFTTVSGEQQAMTGGGYSPQAAQFQSTTDTDSIIEQASQLKEAGQYKQALRKYNELFYSLQGLQRLDVEREIKRLKNLVLLQEKMEKPGVIGTGFTMVKDLSSGGQPEEIATSIGEETYDHDQREKILKRKQAEKLVVEAENTDDTAIAIEKLQDAAHLLLVSGTRRDRVEWVYEKINYLKNYGHIKRIGLFQNERFSPRVLSDYAFRKIDLAKEKVNYGKYKDAVEFYKQSVKALMKAGWTQDQVTYIVQDMINVSKMQDQVEAEEEQLFSQIDNEVIHLVTHLDKWRSGTMEGIEVSAPVDEDIYRPGRERTVFEKEIAKMQEMQERRSTLKNQMLYKLDNAKLLLDRGIFSEAISQYESAIAIMDELGGWNNQKSIVMREISNLNKLLAKQEEIQRIQATFPAKAETKEQADLQERAYLLKQAALLNQENLKDVLIKKKLSDEKEKTAFDILIPIANKLRNEGRYQDALVEFNEALKMLTEAGWTDTHTLQDEIKTLEIKIEEADYQPFRKEQKRTIKDEVFEKIIPAAQKAEFNNQLVKAKELYNEAIDKLKSIGWENHVKPLLDSINEINVKMRAVKEKAAATLEEQKNEASFLVDIGMRFLAKDMKKYAKLEFEKALVILEKTGDVDTFQEITRQIKRLELELKLEESRKILLDKK